MTSAEERRDNVPNDKTRDVEAGAAATVGGAE